MPHSKFDDRYDDHKKIKRTWRREPAAVALHAMAITYCSRHNTDGLIDADWISEKLALLPYKSAQRAAVLQAALDEKLLHRLDDETFEVHDYLEWNLSRAERAELSARGRRGGQARSGGFSGPDDDGSGPGSSGRSSRGLGGGSSDTGPGRLSTPSPTPTPTPHHASGARKRAPARRQPVDQETWPDNLPETLRATAEVVLIHLHAAWGVRGGRIEPQRRGVGLGMLRNPHCDHADLALRLQHWLLAGTGQNASSEDIAKRFGDWCAKEPRGSAPRSANVVPLSAAVSKANAWQNAPEYQGRAG